MIKYVDGTLVVEFRKSVVLNLVKYLVAWPVVLYGLLKKCMDDDYDLVMGIMGVITVVFYLAAFILSIVFIGMMAKHGETIWTLLIIAWFLSGSATPAAIRWRQAWKDKWGK